MKKIYYSLILILFSFVAFAQPANDNCATAQVIGSLPTPAGCPSGVGASLNIGGTLNGATPENPYTYQGVGCTGTNTSMSSPANDVWYTFVATGYQLTVNITGSVVNPNIALYSGSCAALGGGIGGCAVGTAGGAATLTVQQMVPGTTYYLQVSGNSVGAGGNFNLNISNSIDCSACLGATNLTVNPAPVNGAYAPGITVTFCFKVNSYTQINTNWLHGVQLAFGSGWNLGSLTTTPPPSCSGSGTWAYYAAGITDNTGQHWPAGFYYDYNPADGNPGNNFGDNCSGNISAANWNFCFTIKTNVACTPGSNLSVNINTSGDGESGSWSNLGCQNDPQTVFSAIGTCCPPTMSSTQVSCFGGSDGTATATPVGAQGPYSYTWINSTGTIVSSSVAVPGANTASGLPTGTYTVNIIDKNNCLATNTVTITQPTQITLTPIPTNATCGNNNGSISVSAVGGTPAYNYSINGGAYTPTTNYPGLAAGTYTMSVKDNKGCVVTSVVNIITTGALVITVNSATICTGGSVVLTANGATTYSWTPSTTLTSSTGTSVTANPTITTFYTITGTTGGCSSTGTSTVTVNPLPIVTVNSATVCPGANAILTASGANNYSWSTGAIGNSITVSPIIATSYTVTGTDVNGCINTAISTVNINPSLVVIASSNSPICTGATLNLTSNIGINWAWTGPNAYVSNQQNPTILNAQTNMSGVYSVTATDANGCSGTATVNVIINPLPTVTANSNSPICVNGTLNLSSTGGVSYAWTGPNAYVSNQQNPVINGVSINANGAYNVTVTDANGCKNNITTNVIVNPLPVVTATGATVCVNGTINLTSIGGITYSWSGPNAYGSNQQNPTILNAQTNMSGAYVVTVTDANGCVNANVAQVLVNSSLIISAFNNSPICVGATLNLSSNSGVSWSWSGPNAYVSNQQNPIITNAQTNMSGAYTVVGTDANGCTGTSTTNVTINPLPIVTVNSNSPICLNNTINLTSNGGVLYTWTGPNAYVSNQQNPVINNATLNMGGIYSVTATDANGCVNNTTINFVVNSLPIITVNSATICIGSSTTLTANGAINYTWLPNIGLSSVTGNIVSANPNSTTLYTVTGTDINGCINSATSNVIVNPLPIITVTSGTVCAGTATTLTANGANTYNWTPNIGLNSTIGSSVNAAPAISTIYTVTGTNINGCINTALSNVIVNPLPIISLSPLSVSGCSPLCVTYASNSTGSCDWSFGNGMILNNCNPTNCFTNPGQYNVVLTVTNNGCVNTGNATVNVYPIPVANYNLAPQPTTILDPLIYFTDASTNAVVTSWSWNFGDGNVSNVQNPNHNYVNAGTYLSQLIVTSNNGCKDTITNLVIISNDYSLYIPNTFTPNGDGMNDFFTAKGEGISTFKMYIYHRWGLMIFYTEDINKGWDGHYIGKNGDVLQEDTYVWLIEVTNFKGEKKSLSGIVNLIK